MSLLSERKNIVARRDTIIARHKKNPVFSIPLVEIELYNNKLVLRYENKDGVHSHTHIANTPFSNSRTVIADFEASIENFKTALQALPIQSNLILFLRALAIVNVKEELADGLTYIESKTLLDAFLITKLIQRAEICYQDKFLCVSSPYKGVVRSKELQ